MTPSLNSLYSYKKEIVKVKNLYYDCNTSLFNEKLTEGLLSVFCVLDELKTNTSDIFSFHELLLKNTYNELKDGTLDSTGRILCMNIIDDLLNNINCRIKTIEINNKHSRTDCLKLYQEDRYSLYYINDEGFIFEVRTFMYDREYGIDYIVFTDYYDRDDQERYFIANYVEESNDSIILYPIAPEDEQHYLDDVALYDELDEVFNYFDFY